MAVVWFAITTVRYSPASSSMRREQLPRSGREPPTMRTGESQRQPAVRTRDRAAAADRARHTRTCRGRSKRSAMRTPTLKEDVAVPADNSVARAEDRGGAAVQPCAWSRTRWPGSITTGSCCSSQGGQPFQGSYQLVVNLSRTLSTVERQVNASRPDIRSTPGASAASRGTFKVHDRTQRPGQGVRGRAGAAQGNADSTLSWPSAA